MNLTANSIQNLLSEHNTPATYRNNGNYSDKTNTKRMVIT
jgi:hypothetical protein